MPVDIAQSVCLRCPLWENSDGTGQCWEIEQVTVTRPACCCRIASCIGTRPAMFTRIIRSPFSMILPCSQVPNGVIMPRQRCYVWASQVDRTRRAAGGTLRPVPPAALASLRPTGLPRRSLGGRGGRGPPSAARIPRQHLPLHLPGRLQSDGRARSCLAHSSVAGAGAAGPRARDEGLPFQSRLQAPQGPVAPPGNPGFTNSGGSGRYDARCLQARFPRSPEPIPPPHRRPTPAGGTGAH